MEGHIHGVSTGKRGPKITHLFFADDSLLFCKADDVECQTVMDILQCYELVSRQKLKVNKSSVFFNSNTLDSIKASVIQILGVQGFAAHEICI